MNERPRAWYVYEAFILNRTIQKKKVRSSAIHVALTAFVLFELVVKAIGDVRGLPFLWYDDFTKSKH